MLQHSMKSTSLHSPLEVASREAIMNYQNTDVLLKFRKEWDVSPEEAEFIFAETKKFIWLASTSLRDCFNIKVHEQFTIIDEMWHTFIQFTDAYTSFCEDYLGGYLHHYPSTNDMIRKELKHVNETGITYSDYRYNEYVNQIQRIERSLGAETVTTWYGHFAVKYSMENLNALRKPLASSADGTYIKKITPLLDMPADKFIKIIMRRDVWMDNGSTCGCSGKGCGAGCSCNSR
ncbi:hypothetical protein MXF07_24245 [Klebsiella pneumoniae]|uniref:hypothetical protein n=1 Tax=Klebsiella pneumoniae TaxID=573 RepID=UPI001ABBC1E5|nr:hypothetical protein [Klebsiella pneumoniae]MCI8132589.1 hypothetical protein [Klebsiella pneumoniae]MCP3072085.1 hypothetical protein [Klebsiella pneumoniae]MCY4777524.1 hypothetical protein [Klebsiella pneumoniae]MDG0037886.1 hypothetical protein [Klebsiella pneumoniae]MEB5713078.1 hypothetical protein [Klebsiella pneumoniae]